MVNSKRKLIAVVGPTGSGKTALAVELAKKFNGVIISADSRQVYMGLDVGTNKEGAPDQFQGKPRRMIDDVHQMLIDVVDPGERFTLADWLILAKAELEEIWRSDKLPIVVGGTGLYVTALLEGYQPGGGRFSRKQAPVDFQSLILMPSVDRDELYRRSDKRYKKVRVFDKLLAETKELIEKGISPEWLTNIGLDYRYAALHLGGQLGYHEAIRELQKVSRAYIRRQLTWWRHHGPVVTVSSSAEAADLTSRFLRNQE